jgi:hypothetical protein
MHPAAMYPRSLVCLAGKHLSTFILIPHHPKVFAQKLEDLRLAEVEWLSHQMNASELAPSDGIP